MKKIAMLLCAVLCTTVTFMGCGNTTSKNSANETSSVNTDSDTSSSSDTEESTSGTETSSNTASGSYVESSASKKLGTELFSRKFSLNDKIYKLGEVSVKDLEKDGWTLSDGENQKVAASSKSNEVKIKNGKYEMAIVVSNTTTSEINLEDGIISLIKVEDNSAAASVYSSNNGSITISGASSSTSSTSDSQASNDADTEDDENSKVSIGDSVPAFIIPSDIRVGILSSDVTIALAGYKIDVKTNDDRTEEWSVSRTNEYNIQIIFSKSSRVKSITISM